MEFQGISGGIWWKLVAGTGFWLGGLWVQGSGVEVGGVGFFVFHFTLDGRTNRVRVGLKRFMGFEARRWHEPCDDPLCPITVDKAPNANVH